MTIDTKKLKTVELVLSQQDEQIVDRMLSILLEIGQSATTPFFSTYEDVKARTFDLAVLKEEQNYRRPTSEELSQLAREADIQESTGELLDSLKSLD